MVAGPSEPLPGTGRPEGSFGACRANGRYHQRSGGRIRPPAGSLSTLEPAANFVFRRRNALFPIVFVGLLLVFPPGDRGSPAERALEGVGLALVVAGEALRMVTIGLDYIKRGGKRGRFYAENLVTGGIFAHSRNPLYLGNVAVVIGLLLVAGNPLGIAAGGAVFVAFYGLLVYGEERYLAGRFGIAYRAYCADVPRWFPHPRRLWATISANDLDWRRIVRKEYGTVYVACILLLGLLAWKELRGGGWEALGPILPLLGTAFGAVTVLYAVTRYLCATSRLNPPPPASPAGGLDALRVRIDEIDASMLRLLNERAAWVAEIFEIKEAAGVRRHDRKRAQAIIDRLLQINLGPLTDEQVEHLFSTLLDYFAFDYEPGGRRGAESTVDVAADAAVAVEH